MAIATLFAVPDGGLWIGYTRGNASLLEKDGRLIHYTEAEGLPFGRIRSFARDHDGVVWAGAVGGVARFERHRWQRVREQWNFPCRSAWRLFVDREGALWVAAASPDRMLVLPKGAKTFQDVGHPTTVLGFEQIADGTILFVDDAKAKIYASYAGATNSRHPQPILDLRGQGMVIDRDGSLWLAGYDIVRIGLPESGTSLLAPPLSVERFTEKQGLSGSISSQVLEDREGNIWVGTEGGLDRFRVRNVAWERQRDASAQVSLVADNDGGVWALCDWVPSLRKVQDYGKPVPGAPAKLTMGYRAPDGAIWLNGDGKLWRWKNGQFLPIAPPELVTARRMPFSMLAATADRAGRLWIAAGGVGEFYYQDGAWTFVKVLPKRPDLTAVAAHTDSANRIWLVYRDEVAMIDGDRIRVFTAANGLSIGPLITDGGRDDHVWVSGESGLAYLRGDRFHVVRAARSPALGMFTGILAPANDGLWLSASTGIFHIPEAELQRVWQDPAHRIHYELFDVISDLPEPLQTRQTGPFVQAVQSTDGLLWFVTTRGVAHVNPRRLFRNTVPPPVVIRSLVADDRAYRASGTAALPPLTKSIRDRLHGVEPVDPRTRQLPLSARRVGDGVARRRRTAERVLHAARPRGVRFRVTATKSDGVTNDTGAALAFTVAPAWYQTGRFNAAVGVAMGALLFGLYRIRVRQVAAALGQRFDARLAERTRIARELHDTLVQTVQGSKMLADDALQHASTQDRMREAMEQLSEWLEAAVREGRAALNSLRTSSVEAHDLADALRAAANSALKPASMSVSFSVEGEGRELHPIVRDELYRIGDEAMRNAIRHSRGTRIADRGDARIRPQSHTADLGRWRRDRSSRVRQRQGRSFRSARNA